MRQLREAGVTGVLTYSDEDCRLHAVSLPELPPVQAPSFEMCRPATSSGGLGAVDGDVVWAGLGYGTVQVVVSQEDLTGAVMGPGPADAEVGYRAVQAVSLDERDFSCSRTLFTPRRSASWWPSTGAGAVRAPGLGDRRRAIDPTEPGRTLLRASRLGPTGRAGVHARRTCGGRPGPHPDRSSGRVVARRALDGARDGRERVRLADGPPRRARRPDPAHGPRPRLGVTARGLVSPGAPRPTTRFRA
jgi:hypothetical protein